ncbi:MAG: hypothetical protein ACFFCS_01830 [Candidatus Hodarchaeota archaeon]
MNEDQASTGMQTRYMVKRKEEVLSIAAQYIASLGLSESLKDDMMDDFDGLWELFPVGSKFHSVDYFAEILVFHVLKEKGLFRDPIKFCKISPLGDMPMFRRAWLLRYKKYLPRATSQKRKLTPSTYLAELFKNGVLDLEFKNACSQVKKIVYPRMKNNNPRMVAGVICYTAYKSKPEQPISLMRALRTMGITSAGSVYNAVKRFRDHHGIDLDNLHIKTFKDNLQRSLAKASG